MANNFVPFNSTRPTPFVPVLGGSGEIGPALSGHGSPEGAVPAIPKQRYTDIDTGELYLKMAGRQKIGWLLVGEIGQAGSVVIG